VLAVAAFHVSPRWRLVSSQLPSLMPAAALGPPALAGTYAAWPARAAPLQQALYFMTRGPLLVVHVLYINW
jgi:hypothetical protein